MDEIPFATYIRTHAEELILPYDSVDGDLGCFLDRRQTYLTSFCRLLDDLVTSREELDAKFAGDMAQLDAELAAYPFSAALVNLVQPFLDRTGLFQHRLSKSEKAEYQAEFDVYSWLSATAASQEKYFTSMDRIVGSPEARDIDTCANVWHHIGGLADTLACYAQKDLQHP